MARLAILAAAALLGGCMSGPPITVPSNSVPMFPPSSGPAKVAPQSAATKTASQPNAADNSSRCGIYLADVGDTRPDRGNLGMMGGRVVQTEDSVAWVKAALSALNQDRRILVTDDAKSARLSLRVELVKAYIMTMTTQKSANVVIRAIYSRDGQEPDVQVLRGRDTSGNWVNGEDEAQGALNRALADAVQQLGNDIAKRCQASSGK